MAKTLDDIYVLLDLIYNEAQDMNGAIGGAISGATSGSTLDRKEKDKPSLLEKSLKWAAKFIKNELTNAFSNWVRFEKEAYDVGRAIGLNVERLKQFDDVHRKSIRDISARYGVLGKDLAAIQDSYNKAIGKGRIFTAEQLEFTVAMQKIAGSESTMSMIDSMDKLGGSVSTANARLAKMQHTAKKWGLHAEESAKVIAKNVGLATSYHFRGGTEELSKMVIKSQMLRMNFEAIARSSEKFTTIEDAISTAANIQMLGGSFAQAFGNPLEVMYEATSDQAAYMERIFSTLEGKGTYNKETGEVEFSPITRQFMKAYAQQLGMGLEELMAGASSKIQHAEIEKLIQGLSLTEDEKNWIKSQATFNAETKQWEVANYNEESDKIGSTSIVDLTTEQIKRLQANTATEEQSFKDIKAIKNYVQELALGSTTFSEKWGGIKEAWAAFTASGVDALKIGDAAHGIADTMGKWMAPAFTVASAVIGGGLTHLMSKRWVDKKSSSGSAKSSPRGGTTTTPSPRGGATTTQSPRGGTTTTPSPRGGTAVPRPTTSSSWAKGATRRLGGKIPLIGTALSVGLGAMEVHDAYADFDKEKTRIESLNLSAEDKAKALKNAKEERNKATGNAIGNTLGGAGGAALGAALGSVIFPGVGTVIGGILGGLGGGYFGGSIGSDLGDLFTSDEDNKGGGEFSESIAIGVKNIDATVIAIREELGEIKNVVASIPSVGIPTPVVAPIPATENKTSTRADINLNISGTLRLEGERSTGTIDVQKLLDNPDFKAWFDDAVKKALTSQNGILANNTVGTAHTERIQLT